MDKPQRHYTVKDVEMLIAAATIVQSAINNKTALQAKRTTWVDPFFQNLKTKIETTTTTYLGKDAAKDMRQATQILTAIQTKAIVDLAELKVQLEEDFKDTPVLQTEILTQLGFTSYHKPAQKGDQEALINLLYQFKNNLTPALTTQITAKGTAPATLTNITGYALTLKNADITQENYKGTRQEITAEAIIAFNLIYDQVISIAKIAQKFLKADKNKQAQFSFNKVTKTLNNHPATSPENTEQNQ